VNLQFLCNERSLKTEDNPILKEMQVFHNYIKPHMGLDGATPADRAGISG
jgi:hypothetical protein